MMTSEVGRMSVGSLNMSRTARVTVAASMSLPSRARRAMILFTVPSI